MFEMRSPREGLSTPRIELWDILTLRGHQEVKDPMKEEQQKKLIENKESNKKEFEGETE